MRSSIRLLLKRKTTIILQLNEVFCLSILNASGKATSIQNTGLFVSLHSTQAPVVLFLFLLTDWSGYTRDIDLD
jgi:hypothetical protein